MEWRTIDSAPKDGTPILVYSNRWNFGWQDDDEWEASVVCSWNGCSFSIEGAAYHSTEAVDPTHWMPLPPAPQEDKT